jgi:DNA-binding transcriptional regulator YiaG
MSKESDRIKQLEVRLLVYEKSPYLGGYMAILKQITQWNNELSMHPIKLSAIEDEDMRAFDKAMKFLEKQKLLYETIDFLREKLTPKEREDSDKKEVEAHSVEKFILQNGV